MNRTLTPRVDLPLVLVAVTALVGLAAVPALPGRVVVRWTVGPAVQYGPRTLPRLLGVLVVPLAAVLAVLLPRFLVAVDPVRTALGDDRWVVDYALAGVGTLLLAAQVLLVALNLV